MRYLLTFFGRKKSISEESRCSVSKGGFENLWSFGLKRVLSGIQGLAMKGKASAIRSRKILRCSHSNLFHDYFYRNFMCSF